MSQQPVSLTDRSSAMTLIAMLVVGVLSLWVVVMGGVVPREPGAAVTLVSVLAIVADALPVLVVWWLAAAGFGYALRQRGVAQVGVGMAALLLLNWLLLWAGFLNKACGWSLCLVGVALLGVQVFRRFRHRPPDLERQALLCGLPWTWVLAMPGVAMLIVAACCPPSTLWRVEAMGYDVTTYHLQVPREWLAAGGMVELEHNVYSYLPGLTEAAYAMIAAMRRGGESLLWSVYAVQLFHGSFAVLAAAGLASWVGRVFEQGDAAHGRAAGAFAGALLLAVPWVLVTGSLAYNETVVVAMAAVALSLVVGREPPTWRTAAAIGLLAGAATLAKLTAGFTVAMPAGLALVVRMGMTPAATARQRVGAVLRGGGVCAAVGLLVLLPYFARNMSWTGNPVFPFATNKLGLGHWDEARAERWARSHMPDADTHERLEALWRQAIANHGYGTVLGRPTPAEHHNIARFGSEGGVPVLWLLALAGAAAGWWRGRRWAVGLGVGFVLWQLGWWLSMTHLQSRFLIVIVPGLCSLVAIGAAVTMGVVKRGSAMTWVVRGGVAGAALVLAIAAGSILNRQTAMITTQDGSRSHAPIYFLIDALPQPMGTGALLTLPINQLPRQSRVMLIGDNQPLLFIQPSVVYASAFDESPIAPILRETSDPGDVARRLRQQGVTHLYVGYSEIDRLHQTYGFDPEVTVQAMSQLTSDWEVVGQPGPSTLYRVPQ